MEISRALRRLAVLLIVFWIRANAERDIECNGRDFECEDAYNFITCINLPDGQQLYVPNRCKPGTVCNNTNVPDEPCDSKSVAKLLESTASTSTADPPTTLSERSTTPYLRATTKPVVIVNETHNIVPDDIEFVSFSFGLNKNNNSRSIKDNTANVTTLLNVEPKGVVKTSSKITLTKDDITNLTTSSSPLKNPSPMVETNTTIQKVSGQSSSTQFIISTLTQAVFQSSGFMSQSIIAFNRGSRSKDSSSVSVNVTTGFSDSEANKDDVTFTTNTTVQFAESGSNESSLPFVEKAPVFNVSESPQLLEEVPVKTPCQCSESHVMPSESGHADKNNKVNSSSIREEIRPENNLIETNVAESISLKNFTGNENESQNDVLIVTNDLMNSGVRRENEPFVSLSNAIETKVKNESTDIFSLVNDDEEASGDGILYEDIETTTNIIPEDKVLVVSSLSTSGSMYLNSADSTIASMLSKDNLIPAKFETESDMTKQTDFQANETVQIVQKTNAADAKLQIKDIEANGSHKISEKLSKVDVPDELLADILTRSVSNTKLTTEDKSTPSTGSNTTATNLSVDENSTHRQSSTNPLNLTIQFRSNAETLPEPNSEYSSLKIFETRQLNNTGAEEMVLEPKTAAKSNSVNEDIWKENLLSLDDKDTVISVNIININASSETRSGVAHNIDFEPANVAESIKKQDNPSMSLIQVNNITESNNTKRERPYQILNLPEQAVGVDGVVTERKPIYHIDINENDAQNNPITTFDKDELTTFKSTNINVETSTQVLPRSDIKSNFSNGETELEKQLEYENKLDVRFEGSGSIPESTLALILDVESATEQMDLTTTLPSTSLVTSMNTPNKVTEEEKAVEFITWMPDEEILDLELTTEAQITTDEPSIPTTQGALIENTKLPFTENLEEDLKQQKQIGKIGYADIDAYDAETKTKESVLRPERKATDLTETDIKSTESTTLISTIDEESATEPLEYQRLNQHSNKNAELMTISPNWPDLDQLKPHPAVKETTLVNLQVDVPVIVESDIDLLATEAPLEETEASITQETYVTESSPTKPPSVDIDVTESTLEEEVTITIHVAKDHPSSLDSSGAVTVSILPTEATVDASTFEPNPNATDSDKNNLNSTHSQIGYNIETTGTIETTETTIDGTEVKKRAVNKSDHEISAQSTLDVEISASNETSAQILRENILTNLNSSQNQNIHGNIRTQSEKGELNTTISTSEIIHDNQNTSTHFGIPDTTAQTSSSIQNISDRVVTGATSNATFEDSNQALNNTNSTLPERLNSTNLSSLDISNQVELSIKRPPRFNETSESRDNILNMSSTVKPPDSVTEVLATSSIVSTSEKSADTVNKAITRTSASPPTIQTTTTMSTQNVDGRDAADFHGRYFPPEAPQIVSIVSQTGARSRTNATSPSKPKGSFVCKNHGVYPDEDDCKQYFLCVFQNNGYVKITGMCPERYAFSFEIQRCVRDVSSCYEEKCVKAGNFTHPLDDSSFFWCNEVASGVFHKYHMECDAPLKFIPETSTCGIPEKLTSAVSSVRNSTEVTQGTITHNTTVNLTKLTINTTTSPVLIEPNYRLLSATTNTYEKRFIETFNSSNTNQINSTAAGPKSQESEADLIRRSTRSVPDRNQSSFQCTRQGIYPHPANCNQYYMCVKKIPNEISHILRKCPERYAYRADIRACSRDLSVCRNIYCRGMGNHPHPTEESSYYRCVPNAGGGYRVYHIRCEPGKKFIPEQNSCSGGTDQTSSAKNSNLRVLPSTEVPTGGRRISKRSTVEPANDQESQSNGLAVSEAYRREAEQRLRRILSEKRDEAARQYDAKMSGNRNFNDSETSESDTRNGSLERANSRSHEEAFKIVCREEGRFPDPTNCRKYFICSARKTQGLTLHHLDCRGSDRFDATKRICVSEEDVRCA